MSSITDVVIVGGGVIGCSIAYQLRKAGVAVLVIDQGEIGGEASSAAAGLLAPLGSLSGPGPFANLLLASFALFPALVPELEDASGIRMEYEQTGALRVVRSANQRSRLTCAPDFMPPKKRRFGLRRWSKLSRWRLPISARHCVIIHAL